jgi:hypothetical protein
MKLPLEAARGGRGPRPSPRLQSPQLQSQLPQLQVHGEQGSNRHPR